MKQAFLILAHKNFNQLNKLISILDNEKTDIFIHIDSRSSEYELPKCKFSRIVKIPQMRTSWGAYSLVECELRLLETALNNDDYCYFHLLSGQDLPIKPMNDILAFYETHSNYNFIHFDKPEKSYNRYERVKYYYPFLERNKRGKRSIWTILCKIIIIIQKIFRVDRTKKYNGDFKAGSQWWSIRKDVAEYIVSKRKTIEKLFKYTMSDEMFVQTMIYNSMYYDTVYIKEEDELQANQRLIDFNRGTPYTWTIDDFDEINNSELLFARKFDENIDVAIIDKIIYQNTTNKF